MSDEIVSTILMMDIPGMPQPAEHDLDALLEQREAKEAGDGTRLVIAKVRVLVHHGQFETAANITVSDALPLLDSHRNCLSQEELCASYMIAATARLLYGDAHLAYVCTNTAFRYAQNIVEPAFMFWCKALQAAATAENGESTLALIRTLDCEEYAANFDYSTRIWPLVLARIFIRALISRDDEDIERALVIHDNSLYHSDTTENDWLTSMLLLDTCVARERAGQYDNAITSLERMTLGVDSSQAPTVVSDAAGYLLALLLMHTGKISDVMIILKQLTTRADNIIDFDLLRAAVYLHIGEYNKALRTVNFCLANCRIRNMRTPITAMLLRAASYQLLGKSEMAVPEFERAVALSTSLGNNLPTLGLPTEALVLIATDLGLNVKTRRLMADDNAYDTASDSTTLSSAEVALVAQPGLTSNDQVLRQSLEFASLALSAEELEREVTADRTTDQELSPATVPAPEIEIVTDPYDESASKPTAAKSTVPDASAVRISLTAGQRKVARELTGTHSLPKIAKDLFLSLNTVKSHTRVIYRKLGVTSRADAVTILLEHPWILVDDFDLQSNGVTHKSEAEQTKDSQTTTSSPKKTHTGVPQENDSAATDS